MKILILEDNPISLQTMIDVMKEQGHSVLACTNIIRAIEYIENEENIHLVVVDLNMSTIGLTIQQNLRSRVGSLTGWIFLVDYVFKKNPNMKGIVFSAFICELENYLEETPDEKKYLENVTLITKGDIDATYIFTKVVDEIAKSQNVSDNACKTVFLSFCSRDSAIANIVDQRLKQKDIVITRWERGVGYKDNFREFMDSLKDHDFILSIISDQYLKSRACMYEVGKIIEEPSFQKKLLYIVLSDDDKQYYDPIPSEPIAAKVYNLVSHLEYLEYWKNEYETLKRKADEIGIFIVSSEHKALIDETKEILDDIQKFIFYICYARGIPFNELIETDFKVIKDAINPY